MFDLGRFLPYLLNRAGARIATAFGGDVARYGVTLQMWRVLAALWHSGAQRLGDLAELTSIEVSTLSRLVGGMEAKGLVTRVRSDQDARVVTIDLTDDGRETTRRIIPLALHYEAVALDGLTGAEAEQLKELLRRVYANMAKLDEAERLSVGG